jgi:hypothetical protein
MSETKLPRPFSPAAYLREAKARLEKAKTVENALAVQTAERMLRDWRRENTRLVYTRPAAATEEVG